MFKKYFKNKKNKGASAKLTAVFTIIEMMIAIAIFLIVITIGMTSLLNATNIHKKSQNMRSIMDSLSFIMEDMSRNLRTGYDYHCIADPSTVTDWASLTEPLSCPNKYDQYNYAGGISFKSPNPDGSFNQIIYFYFYGNGNLEKSTDGGKTFTRLNPEGVTFSILNNKLGTTFWVYGAEHDSGEQPLVTIIMNGTIDSQGTSTSFSLQTSVSQRLINI